MVGTRETNYETRHFNQLMHRRTLLGRQLLQATRKLRLPATETGAHSAQPSAYRCRSYCLHAPRLMRPRRSVVRQLSKTLA